MITLLATYLITAHLFSGLFCYAVSLASGSVLPGPDLIKVITNIWIPLMWPVWILSEVWRLNRNPQLHSI